MKQVTFRDWIILTVVVIASITAYLISESLIEYQRERVSTQRRRKALFIGHAMGRYHDANGHYPPPYVCDANGNPLLSWRVLLLPYLGENALFEKFDLTKSWDAPENLPLIQAIPEWYAEDGELESTGRTRIVAITGSDTIWEWGRSKSPCYEPFFYDAIAAMRSSQATPIWSAPGDIDIANTFALEEDVKWLKGAPREASFITVSGGLNVIREGWPFTLETFRGACAMKR